ncbi:hypothetical protein I4U23_011672 [Adineta vaga]|nr:hypothetical protein I4U23_011672 [Adineta vaga]
MAATVFLVFLTFYLALGVSSLKLQKCPAGFFCAKSMRRSFTGDDDYELPQACPRGTWSSAEAVECIKCPKGYYTWDEAATYCERCEPGYMCIAPNVDPEPCPMGTYSPDPAQTCCKVCKSGSYTPRKASISCTRCRPGTYCARNEIRLACAQAAETTSTVSTSITTENDVCLNGTRCMNGGTCRLEGASSFRCLCPDAYTGEMCERPNDERTITEVFTRNNWTYVLAVIDVTGSMSPCASAVMQWISLAHERKLNIKTYVFFNDGDSKNQPDKVIGSTGGIYATNSTNLSVVHAVMQHAMNMGGGGDDPENDVEALLYGIEQCPTCQNVIHIADNEATPRDMILLSRVGRPIKVVPCQVHSTAGVNPALLSIAAETGGSLHTIEQDIINLSGIAVGETINIGHHVYQRTNDSFVRI